MSERENQTNEEQLIKGDVERSNNNQDEESKIEDSNEQTNEDQDEESKHDDSNKNHPRYLRSKVRELRKEGTTLTLGSFFLNTIANTVTSINDDKYIEEEFKNKILNAIQFFNTEYTKTIKGDGDKSNDNRNTEITGITKDAIKQRGQKILTILDDTLGLFSNIDDDNFFNKLNNFIKNKNKVKTLKDILSKVENDDIKQLFDGDHKHTSNEDDSVDEKKKIMMGEHGIRNHGGKRIKKRTKKNKKSSKKTKRNRK